MKQQEVLEPNQEEQVDQGVSQGLIVTTSLHPSHNKKNSGQVVLNSSKFIQS